MTMQTHGEEKVRGRKEENHYLSFRRLYLAQLGIFIDNVN